MWNKERHAKIHIKIRQEIPPPSAEIIVKWFVVICPPPPLQTTKKSERTNSKWGQIFWKVQQWFKEKSQSQNLPAHCFVSAQGKIRTTWDTQLTTCSRTGACSMSIFMFAKQIGWKKSELSGLRMHDDRKTNNAPKSTHTLFLETTIENSTTRKNKCELMTMTFDATPWGY